MISPDLPLRLSVHHVCHVSGVSRRSIDPSTARYLRQVIVSLCVHGVLVIEGHVRQFPLKYLKADIERISLCWNWSEMHFAAVLWSLVWVLHSVSLAPFLLPADSARRRLQRRRCLLFGALSVAPVPRRSFFVCLLRHVTRSRGAREGRKCIGRRWGMWSGEERLI